MSPSSVYKSYFENYTKLVSETDVLSAVNNQDPVMEKLFESVSEEKSNYAYAKGKWTLKEMMQHLVDTERIFAYRALAIARQDPANLPGYDENLYADNSSANRRTWADLTEEMKLVRQTTKMLFASFTPEMLESSGTFNNNEGTVQTLGLIIPGHFYHHVNVAEERYFK